MLSHSSSTPQGVDAGTSQPDLYSVLSTSYIVCWMLVPFR